MQLGLVMAFNQVDSLMCQHGFKHPRCKPDISLLNPSFCVGNLTGIQN